MWKNKSPLVSSLSTTGSLPPLWAQKKDAWIKPHIFTSTSQKHGFIAHPYPNTFPVFQHGVLTFPVSSRVSWRHQRSSSSAHELTLFPYFDALLRRLPLTLRCQREIHHAARRKKTWHCRLRRPLHRDEIQSCSHPPLPSLLFLYHFLLPSSFHFAPNIYPETFIFLLGHHSFPLPSLKALKDPGLHQEPLLILLSCPNT